MTDTPVAVFVYNRPDLTSLHMRQLGAQDPRGRYPPLAGEPVPELPDPDSLAFDDDYADLATYLEFLLTSAEPRKWRVLADAARGRDDVAPSMRLRLRPWQDRTRSAAILDHLSAHMTSARLSALREALR